MESGKIYEGTFENNNPCGQGKLTVPGTGCFEGTFTPQGDKFSITGVLTRPDNTVVQGTWGAHEQS